MIPTLQFITLKILMWVFLYAGVVFLVLYVWGWLEGRNKKKHNYPNKKAEMNSADKPVWINDEGYWN